jgi:hypothetical protein
MRIGRDEPGGLRSASRAIADSAHCTSPNGFP